MPELYHYDAAGEVVRWITAARHGAYDLRRREPARAAGGAAGAVRVDLMRKLHHRLLLLHLSGARGT